MIVIKGDIHSGKSSIGQAISMNLAPSTDGLDAKGSGFITKIRRGQQKAVIEADIQDSVHQVRKTVTLNTNTSGRTHKCVCLDSEDWHPLPFEKLLDDNRAAIMICCNTDWFFSASFDEAKQKTMLGSLVLPDHHDFPADKIAAVERMIGQGVVNFAGDPLAAIDTAYKKLYAERTRVNRQVDEFSIPDAMELPKNVDSASLQAKLVEARAKRQTIMAERDKAFTAANDANVKRATLEAKITSLQTKGREENDRLTAANARVLTELEHGRLTAIAEKKGRLEDIRKQRQQNQGAIDTCQREVAKLEKVESLGGLCPVCEQSIDTAKLKSIIAELRENLATVKQTDIDLVRQEAEIGDVAGAERSLKDHAEASVDKKAIESRLNDITRQLTKARSDLINLPATVDAAAPFADRLQQADTAITELEAQLRPVIVAEERVNEIAKKTEDLSKLRAKAATLDTLVKYFDKDGVKAELLSKNIGGFTDKLNAILCAWGYSCAFSIEPYEFNITDTLGVTTPLGELSGSEKWQFLLALQCAVSELSGIGLVVTDRMDILPSPERQRAAECLYNSLKAGKLDQVWTIMTSDDDTVPDIAAVAAWKVENGVVTRL